MGGQTVQSFLSGQILDNDHQSLLSMRAKASILYEKSAQIAARWTPRKSLTASSPVNLTPLMLRPASDTPSFQSQFVALDNRIEQFKAALPSLSQATSMHADVVRSLLAIHTLCHCATIQLHSPFAGENHNSSNKVMTAAHTAASVLQGIPVPQLIYVDPIMGVSLKIYCRLPRLRCLTDWSQVLWAAIGHTLRSSFLAWQSNARVTSTVAPPPAALAIKASMDTVMAAMQALGGNCPLVGTSDSFKWLDDRQ